MQLGYVKKLQLYLNREPSGHSDNRINHQQRPAYTILMYNTAVGATIDKNIIYYIMQLVYCDKL